MLHHTTRTHILPLIVGTLIALAAFASVLWFIDPYTTGIGSHFFFYLTLFLSSGGIFAIAGILIRKKFMPGILAEQMSASIRQAILLSLLVTGLVMLQTFNVLMWWVAATLILFIIILEIFFNV